ncbi:MAG: hypothetical protein D6718_06355 [Acidobacteria bacterium]|nr:MAG: hypothetical protein D6718_06355 [Acidobacteriota bacterium]
MRKLAFTAFIAAVVLSLGCAITNYPVMFDDAGPWDDATVDSFYDKAYIIPSGQVATIWSDGSDELYTEVAQDWKGDQRLYTYNNFDPSASVLWLDQTYCDPARQDNCSIWTAWNPDLPDAYPTAPTGQSGDPSPHDDPFDGVPGTTCPGYRSLSVLVSYGSRIGECGSGLWLDKQAAADEFSRLGTTTWRGEAVYHLPFNSSIASVQVTGANGNSDIMPIYGSFNGYIDSRLRVAVEMTPNAKYELRWLSNWLRQNGSFVDVTVTYGSLTANWKANIWSVDNALNRL